MSNKNLLEEIPPHTTTTMPKGLTFYGESRYQKEDGSIFLKIDGKWLLVGSYLE